MPVASLSKIKWQKVARCIIFVVRNIYSWLNEQKAHFHMQPDLKIQKYYVPCNSIRFFCNGCPVTTGPFGVWKREAHVGLLRCVTVFDKMAVESELCKLRSWNVVIFEV